MTVAKPESSGNGLRGRRNAMDPIGEIRRDAQQDRNATSLSRSDVERTVVDVLAEITRYPREILTPEAQFDEDLGIDSLKRVEIVTALLNRFGQAPSDLKELGPLPRTVGELTHFAVEYVSKLSGIDHPASDGKHATEMVSTLLAKRVVNLALKLDVRAKWSGAARRRVHFHRRPYR